jgi:hypothetical protein
MKADTNMYMDRLYNYVWIVFSDPNVLANDKITIVIAATATRKGKTPRHFVACPSAARGTKMKSPTGAEYGAREKIKPLLCNFI